MVELLLASTIMLLIAGMLGTMALSVETATEQSRSRGTAVQIGRVAISRIERAITEAHGNETFPGCLVLSATDSGDAYPDTLIVWSPAGAPVNPTGLPRMDEIVVFRPLSSSPNIFREIRTPADTRNAPAASATSAWTTRVAEMEASSSAEIVNLTTRLRTASTTSNARRGVVRFAVRMRPSAAEWSQYKASTLAWENLAWPLGAYGSSTGTRNITCDIELHISTNSSLQLENNGESSIPFFGSASLLIALDK